MSQVNTIHRTWAKTTVLRFCVWLVSKMFDNQTGYELVAGINHIMHHWAEKQGRTIYGQCMMIVEQQRYCAQCQESGKAAETQVGTTISRSGHLTPQQWSDVWEDAAHNLPFRGINIKGW